MQARRLLEYRTICTNIDAALDMMGKCSYVLNLAMKAQDQIDNSKYLVALKVNRLAACADLSAERVVFNWMCWMVVW